MSYCVLAGDTTIRPRCLSSQAHIGHGAGLQFDSAALLAGPIPHQEAERYGAGNAYDGVGIHSLTPIR